MGLDWNFVRITPEQRLRLLSQPSYETTWAIDKEREQEGLGYWHSPDDVGEDPGSFDTIYHLGLRTFYDELEDLMLLEGDDGPVLSWPLGDTGQHLPGLHQDMCYLLDPEEVRTLAPAMQLLLDQYLDQRYARMLEQLEDTEELEELYPELRTCFTDLTRFVQAAANKGEAIMWFYG